jgi:hypothetical protein
MIMLVLIFNRTQRESIRLAYYRMAQTLPQEGHCIAQAFFQQLGVLQIEL